MNKKLAAQPFRSLTGLNSAAIPDFLSIIDRQEASDCSL